MRAVLREFGVASARRAVTTDSTEEVLLLNANTFASADVDALTQALMTALPHTKVWVVEDMSRWRSEPL